MQGKIDKQDPLRPRAGVLTPPSARLKEDGPTGRPGEWVVMPSTVYQVQADGSWKKVKEPLASEIRKREEGLR